MRYGKIPLLLSAFILSAAPLQSAEIVKNGSPAAEIVLSEKPTSAAQFAALELRHHLQLMTGAVLPIVKTPGKNTKCRIYVGDNPKYASENFGEQEYLQEVSGNSIYLCGRDAKNYRSVDYAKVNTFPDYWDENGSLYAVYDFLESIGVRWYLPTAIGTVFRQQQDLSVKDFRKLRRPSFLYRDRFAIGMPADLCGDTIGNKKDVIRLNPRDLKLFYHRSRQGGKRMEITHSLYTYYGRFYKTHPEWFAQGYKSPSKDMQLCLTNPGLIAQVVQDARDFFDGKLPDVSKVISQVPRKYRSDCYPLGAMDNGSWCICSNCRKLLLPKATEGKGFSNNAASEYWYTFVAKVAAEVKKTHPDKIIGSFAYSSYAFPPEKVKLPDNVMIRPAMYVLRSYSEEEMAYIAHLLESWTKRYPNVKKCVSIWYCFPNVQALHQKTRMFPHFEGHHVARYFALFKKFNPIGMFWEPSYVVGGASPLFDMVGGYINWRLAWDIDADAEKLYDEIFTGFYGPAAAPMKAFYDLGEKLYSNPANWNGMTEMNTDIAWNRIGNGENMKKLQGFINQALKAADVSPYKERVELFNRTFWAYMKKGRENAVKQNILRAPSMQKTTAAYLPVNAGGDSRRIPWDKIKPIKMYGGLNGEALPKHIDLQIRVVHDGRYIYFNYTQNDTDFSKMETGKGVWGNDEWESFFARQRGVPYHQMAIDFAGNTGFVDNNGIQITRWNFPGRLEHEKIGKRWTVFISCKLSDIVHDGIKPGETLYYNVVRAIRHPRTICIWVPTFADFTSLDRLGEIYLEPVK